MRSVLLWLLAIVTIGPVLGVVVLWTSIALYYLAPLPDVLSSVLAWGYALAALALPLLWKKRWRALGVNAAVYLVVLVWFMLLSPRTDLEWMPELARTSRVKIDGDLVHITNIRNCHYRSIEDFDVRYYDKTFDLSKLKGVDYIISHWETMEYGHVMMSWDFGGDDVLCLSVEVRREVDEGWGGLPGIYKQFEIIYLLADETDVIGRRTGVEQEDVYLFPTNLTPAMGRQLLMRILEVVEDLNDNPAFYHTIYRNCTTAVINHINEVWPGRMPITVHTLLNGYIIDDAYALGRIETDLSLEEYKKACRVTDLGQEAQGSEHFSRRIRAHFAKVRPDRVE